MKKYRFSFSILMAIAALIATTGSAFGQITLLHSQLSNNSAIYSTTKPTFNSPQCPIAVEKAKFVLRLYIEGSGGDYELGKNAFSNSIEVSITGLNNLNATLFSEFVTLKIDETAPETIWEYDCTSSFTNLNKIALQINAYSSNPLTINRIKLKAGYDLRTTVDVKNFVISVFPLNTNNNPVNFSWKNTECGYAPNYELQVLRLYNKDPLKTSETNITATVNWDKALTVETQSNLNSQPLTLSEGTGFYVWRVRAIGNNFPGGYSNINNYGIWSNDAYWQSIATANNEIILNGTTQPTHIFFYKQFDADLNWAHSRTFSEASPNETRIKIDEQMTYANGLEQVTQQQMMSSYGRTLVNETILDFSGRPALSTMYAPVNQNNFGRVTDFVKNGSQHYAAQNFDQNSGTYNFNNPAPVTGGQLDNYWSDANSDKSIPSAGGYPYSRTLFYGDGMGRPKEVSGLGPDLRIGAATPHTTRYYYSGVADIELVRIFGDEAPDAKDVLKTVTVDPNQTVSIAYQSAEGQTLATCLSTNDNSAHHLPLPSRTSFPVEDQVTGYISCGDNCIRSAKTFFLNEPKTVSLSYEIAYNELQNLCPVACKTCDYKVIITLKRLDDPYDTNFPKVFENLLTPQSCPASGMFTWAQSYALPPGLYEVEKRIYSNNNNPTTVSATDPVGYTFLEEQLVALEAQMRADIQSNTTLQTINTYLENGQTEALYTALGVTSGQTSYGFQAGCCNISMPINHCKTCQITDFEGYLATIQPAGKDWLLQYSTGEFNTMIQSMVANGYSSEQLCNCWMAAVGAFQQLSTQNAAKTDLLSMFLDCTGRKLKGCSTNPTGAMGYLNHPYAWIKYTTPKPSCEEIYGVPALNSVSIWPTENLLNFYYCTISAQTPITVNPNVYTANECQKVEDACKNACESRFDGFLAALKDYYEDQLGYTVSNSVTNHALKKISWQDLYCQAQSLVNLCKQDCTLDLVLNNSGQVTACGTAAQQLLWQQALAYSFDVVANIPSQTTCSTPYRPGIVGESNIGNTLSYFLENQINTYIDGLNSSGNFNLTAAVASFFGGATPSNCLNQTSSIPILPGDYCISVIKNCTLTIIIKRPNPAAPNGAYLMFYYDICVNICQKILNCTPACLKWVSPVITNAPDHVFSIKTCEQAEAEYASLNLDGQIEACIKHVLDEYKFKYKTTCLDPAKIKDKLVLKYELGYYHYTLYYYDRAGNLVQTIPPKDVNTTSTNRLQHPVHGLPSQYQYNSLQELVSQNNPDGGETKFYYNRKGQLRFSRNAQQIDDGTFSYTRYDKLGRIAEIGKSTYAGQDLTTSVLTDDQTFPSTACTERIYTIYTESAPASMLMPGRTQRYLLNRVSYVSTDDNAAIVYSYDPHGNVEWLIQVVPNLGKKTIEYQYDLLSNKVTQVRYNPGEIDQFYTKYTYDADDRLSTVRTSRDGVIWDKDAYYDYYEHGPLRRNQLGEDRIQGIDYTYTLQGWLKSINHPSLQTANDPGQDGATSVGSAPDVFASGLTYWGSEFVKTGSPFANGNTGFLAPTKTLYNGNISTWTSNTAVSTTLAPNFKYSGLTGQTFEYDELNRLRSAAFKYFQSNTWNNTAEYGSTYTYDANGNLDKLMRNGFQKAVCGSTNAKMDDFTYNYISGKNQLRQVTDAICDAAYTVDIDNQANAANYVYDKNGNLIEDKAEKLAISWNLMGKVKQVKKTGGSTIDFTYDAGGNRIAKVVFDPVTLKTNSTWYVYDAAGNLLSTYRQDKANSGFFRLWQDEILIYGSERMGIYEPTWMVTPDLPSQPGIFLGDAVGGSRRVGLRTYELNDHLGNVRATISDIKLSTVNSSGVAQGVFSADIRSDVEYYPFGMGMPERTYASGGYRFGFQGQEKEFELNNEGNTISFLYRLHDSRVGRFLSIDPLSIDFAWNSPYVFSENRLVDGIEFEGLEKKAYKINMGKECQKSFKSGQFTSLTILPKANLFYKIKTKTTRSQPIQKDYPDIQLTGQRFRDKIKVKTKGVITFDENVVRDQLTITGKTKNGEKYFNQVGNTTSQSGGQLHSIELPAGKYKIQVSPNAQNNNTQYDLDFQETGQKEKTTQRKYFLGIIPWKLVGKPKDKINTGRAIRSPGKTKSWSKKIPIGDGLKK